MSNKKPEFEGALDPKVRNCLACLRPFSSGWAGERVCTKCKSSSSWRGGVTPR